MSSTNAFSYEQTIVLRRAVDIVLARDNATTERYRQEVARVVLQLANENEFDDAEVLAQLAIEQLDERWRKTA
jgi:hypothetical protein